MSLFFTVSGLRGISLLSLTPEYVLKVAASFCNLYETPFLIVGRDSRPSGRYFIHAVISAALSKGKKVLDSKIVPTPTLVYSVKKREKESSGIIVTASHNPPEWNALKFVHPEGRFLFEEEIERLKKEIRFFNWEKTFNVGTSKPFDPMEEHIKGIIENKYVLTEIIKEKKFKVGVDTAGGAGFEAFPLLLKKLGCEVFTMDTQYGKYERPFELSVENIKKFGDFVKEKDLDIGFAMDADGDRLQIVAKGGEILSEEETLPICLYYLLSKEKSDIVTNFSTTEHVEDVAERFNVRVLRTKVGEANVLKKMIEEDAIYGGEGNGGVIVKNFNMTRDAFFASALILSFLTEMGDSREFKKLFRKRIMKKLKFPISERKLPEKIEEFLCNLNSSEVNKEDGIRVKFQEGFIHARVSNTEPVLRVIMEAKETEVIKEWEKKIKELI
ncbi:MAG: phosphoglucosamine mutase [candidate division WOR-3 bacterium]